MAIILDSTGHIHAGQLPEWHYERPVRRAAPIEGIIIVILSAQNGRPWHGHSFEFGIQIFAIAITIAIVCG